MRYLLDSTLLIDHGNGDQAAIELLDRLVEEGHDLYTCDVVTCEALSRGEADDLRHICGAARRPRICLDHSGRRPTGGGRAA